MKRYLWVGLLLLSNSVYALFEDEGARKKLNEIQDQLNALQSSIEFQLNEKFTNFEKSNKVDPKLINSLSERINTLFDDLAKFYGLYEEIMSFWHQIYPNKIYDISYEELTNNQEKETRDLLDYCNLDWDQNCLKFHENKLDVNTASALQVRKKMYQGSSDAWKKYEKFLEPLVKSLKEY